MPTYTGISSEAFRHPLDRQAEQTLRSVPGFDLVARKFVEFMSERPNYVYHMGNSIQVGPRQYSTVYHLFRECAHDLDVYPEPGLFISQTPLANAYAFGQEKPCVILNSGLLDLLSETEIRAVLAHELGHIKCDHTTLTQMAIWVIDAAHFLGNLTLGIGNIISTGLILAFYEWSRKAELSADRAALLIMDDLNPVMQTMMKLAGGSLRHINEISLNEFILQSENYQALDQDGLNQLYKFLLYNGGKGWFLSHPFPVERLHYLRDWSTSEEYRQIRMGNYQHTGAEGAVNVSSETTNSNVEDLRNQIEKLQNEINRLKRSNPPNSP